LEELSAGRNALTRALVGGTGIGSSPAFGGPPPLSAVAGRDGFFFGGPPLVGFEES
jgi:hypothetical protein